MKIKSDDIRQPSTLGVIFINCLRGSLLDVAKEAMEDRGEVDFQVLVEGHEVPDAAVVFERFSQQYQDLVLNAAENLLEDKVNGIYGELYEVEKAAREFSKKVLASLEVENPWETDHED